MFLGVDQVYTATLVSSTTDPMSLPETSSRVTTRGAVVPNQTSFDESRNAASIDDSGSNKPQSLLLSSPKFETVTMRRSPLNSPNVTLRRSPVTSPSRNRSVRSDFILNLVQQGISSEVIIISKLNSNSH